MTRLQLKSIYAKEWAAGKIYVKEKGVGKSISNGIGCR